MQTVAMLGTILGIWAHPDDETWSSAGVMAAARENGQRVVCVVATDGGRGKTADAKRWPQSSLYKIRLEEMRQALSEVNVDEVRLLNLKDGALKSMDEAAIVNMITDIISEVQPDTIITFEPGGITGHTDHKIISACTVQAVQQCGSDARVLGACETDQRYHRAGCHCDEAFNIYFNTPKPTTIGEEDAAFLLRLTPELARKKRAALQAHASQTAALFDHTAGRCYIDCLCETEAFISLN